MTWFACDTGVLRDDRISLVGATRGPAAGTVWLTLLGAAKERGISGRVEVLFRLVGAEAFVDGPLAEAITEDLRDVGLLAIEDHEPTVGCTVTLASWGRYQRDAAHAKRQAKYRDRQKRRRHAGVTQASPIHRTVDKGQKPKDKSSAPSRTDAPLCHLLADLIKGNGSKRPDVIQRWADAERLLLKRDGRPFDEAEALVRWCQADEFWRGNILSMPKFREKYDTLRLQRGRSGNGTASLAEHRINAGVAAVERMRAEAAP